MRRIYLDYAATTPLDPAVLAAMTPYFSKQFGNPSSVHSFGQDAQRAVDGARAKIAACLAASPQEIIFTASATEANNLALAGVVRAYGRAKKDILPHIVVSSTEHESVLEVARSFAARGEAEVSYAPVSREGVVDVPALERMLRPETLLVSIGLANSEIGVIQPIAEISQAVLNFRKNSKVGAGYPLLHTDAAQGVYYLKPSPADLGVDLLTISGHKIYGPKGVGVLYVKRGTQIAPVIVGSGQEYGKRSGTENVPGIVGMGAAVDMAYCELDSARDLVARLRDRFVEGVFREIPDVALNGSREQRLPHNANILFCGVSSADLILLLDREGIAVSAGTACQAKAGRPSHVLAALGLSERDVKSSVRFSLGRQTTAEDIDRTVSVLVKLVQKLRL